MKTGYVWAAYLIFIQFLLTGLLIQVSQATRFAGVHPGDSSEYFATLSGNMSNMYLQFEYAKVIVLGVSGLEITFKAHALNGSVWTNTTYVHNLETGENGSLFFIAANLTAGDLIFPSAPFHPGTFTFVGATINETIYRDYPGGPIEVNHWNVVISYSKQEANFTDVANVYWEKSTGRLIELSWFSDVKAESAYAWGEMSMIIPELNVVIFLPLFMTITLFVAILRRNIQRELNRS